MIRFRVPIDGVDCVAFAYSPLLEAVLSLHVLVEPKHHPLQHPWVRAMRRLPPALRREIAGFGFAFRGPIADFATPPENGGFGDFAEELEVVETLAPADVALDFLRPLYDHGGDRDPAVLDDPAVRTHALAAAGRIRADPDLVALVFDDPAALAARFTTLLRTYWEEAFAAEWERLEPKLAETIAHAGRRIAADGLYGLLGGLSPRLVVDPAGGEIRRDLPHEHTVEATPERRLMLVPSVYVWPDVRTNCDEPWPLSVVYPAPFVAADARPPLPDTELVRVLRSLGDGTRLRALRLISERPRSTQELAPLVGLSEAGLSKQLRALADAGVVTTRREGYYVLYALANERLDALVPALQSFLGRDVPRDQA